MEAKLHPESLLRIPLINQAFFAPDYQKHSRAVDAGWVYGGILRTPVTGFNPFLSEFFYGEVSQFSQWIKTPQKSPRGLNEEDILLKEVFYLVHDYLHAWAYGVIDALMPELKIGQTPITKKNFEDYVFCHLLTETVATVGLDYWYLSTVNFNELCNIGTTLGPLTTPYRLHHEKEYRHFNAGFSAQEPDFFSTLCRFYCDGAMPGFTLDDLRLSPLTLKWLRHELEYGETQREYTRSWFNHLSVDPQSLSYLELTKTVKVEKLWQAKLIKSLEGILWAKIKEGRELVSVKPLKSLEIFAPVEKKKNFDMRFTNLNAFEPKQVAKWIQKSKTDQKKQFRYFFRQFISGFDFSHFDFEKQKSFAAIIKNCDYAKLMGLFKDEKRIRSHEKEPSHLLFLA